MKKIYLLLFLVFLSSCFFNSNQDEVNQAKEELLSNTASVDSQTEDVNTDSWDLSIDDSTQEETQTTDTNQQKSTITSLSSWDATIKIDDLSDTDFSSKNFYIYGETLSTVDKITVSFSNETSSFPTDVYTLKQFKSWDSSFKYLAAYKYQTLDYWLNTYIFTAYSGDSVYKIKVEINLPKEDTSTTSSTTTNTGNTITTTTSDTTTQTYSSSSSSDNLEVEKNFTVDLTCDNLTDFLTQYYTYSYWNTCRDLTKWTSITFFVLRLNWDKYFYEKHYVNYDTKEHWILLLQTWTWVTKDNIAEKNSELKQQTWDTSKIDQLFK